MNKTWKKVGKEISAESKKPLDAASQFFCILICLLDAALQFFCILICLFVIGMIIPIPGTLIGIGSLVILYYIRRGKKKRK